MGVFSNRKPKAAEQRALVTAPWAPFDVGPTYNHASITASQAMTLPPVAAAIRLLVDNISTLPLHAYRHPSTPGSPATETSLPSLLVSPSPNVSLHDWLAQLVKSVCLFGNAYGFVTERLYYGYPTGITWLNPTRVHVDESGTLPVYRVNGKQVSTEDIVHVRWQPEPGCLVSPSPLDALGRSIAAGLSAMDYKANFFSNGASPSIIFKNSKKTLTGDEAATLKQRFSAALSKQGPIVLGDDWDLQAVTPPSVTSEWQATMTTVATQVANVYGVPASRIGGTTGESMHYSTVEMESLDFVTLSLRPWLEKIENSLSALLPDNVYVSFDTDELLRTDTEARARIDLLQRQMGARSVNENRERDNLPPIEGGDDYTPLAAEISTYTAAQQAAQAAQPKPSPVQGVPNDPAA